MKVTLILQQNTVTFHCSEIQQVNKASELFSCSSSPSINILSMYHLKCNPTAVIYCCTKMKWEAGPPHVTDSSNLPLDTQIKVKLVARPVIHPSCAKTVQMWTWYVLEQRMYSFIQITHEALRNWNNTEQSPRNTLQSWKNAHRGSLSLRRGWTFSAAAVKLFCEFFLPNK
jgi:hypothetical protein